jgi:hypothetical protein
MSSTRINAGFYLVVLAIALTGAGQAATGWLGWWPPCAFAAVAAVELGGVALSVHADERRQLGERALPARLLSAAVATGAVLTNFFGHITHPGRAWFFAGMSALGYTVWIIQSGARRRDQLRATGKLQHTPPAYGMLCWLTHPVTTTRARHIALANPTLGTVDSLTAAHTEHQIQRQRAAIATVLHRKLRATVDPATADLATAVYDLDEIAERLRASADYPGLTALVAADLAPSNLAPKCPPSATDPGAVPNPPAGEPRTPSTADLTAGASLDPPREPVAAPQKVSATATPATAPGTPTPARPRIAPTMNPAKRTFAMTRQAATSLEASGMGVPEIAVALGITQRQVRKALQPAIPAATRTAGLS